MATVGTIASGGVSRLEDLEALARAHIFVSIGTSGAVYPAARFVQTARYCGARALELKAIDTYRAGVADAALRPVRSSSCGHAHPTRRS